ncbi:HAD family acid phosphatase [Sphingomonas sp.]|uniref:HAD family acid phosphatase n=1 Tax=Sphingomonas sp. TaxID=28214 RepID=UPI0025FE1281|nr:HAD family acid phosphatase [Sphingomonas sp.]
MTRGRLALLMLLVGSTVNSGCVAAAVPVLAAGAIGKKQFFGKKDEDLPSATPPAVAAASVQAAPAGIPASDAIPSSGPVAAPTPPPPGTVPPGMQYLYGSGEASAVSIQAYLSLTDFLVARGGDFAVGHPISSVVLAPDATLDAPKFLKCGPRQRPAVVLDIDETALLNLGYEADDSQRSGAYDQKRWDRWEASGVTAVDPVPGVLDAVRAARASGIEVVFNSNRASANAAATIDALTLAGLGPVVHFQNLWLKGDDASGGSGKDARRWAISAKYCVIAMVGDQLGDFSDLFNLPGTTPAQRRAQTNSPKLRMLWGHGWFVLPNPVYGTALKGDIDDVFPKDRRWTDPGAQPISAAPPSTPSVPTPAEVPASPAVKK